MPEISLKAYFAKLNNLLGVNSADEVVQHSRHILQSYPKNVTAYRFLGRALVLGGRWEEGREALRRVLSVYPDDYVAHLGLSEANEHLDHPDEAIWHLERAYEQNSNNKDVIEALRNLYRRYRNIDNLKMQLTSAAVARQNLRSKNYTQAIDTLRSARARMNDRLDLKLLLAQVLWEHGSQEEAAEIAVDVLKVLPDCLEANRIMAQLWLSMNRPSDAQRYVNHLEAVDPYLAVEVAQGFPPDDDVFRLEELDYVRTSQSEMASARPDWLTEIGSSPLPVTESASTAGRDDWSSLMLGGKSSSDVQGAGVEAGALSRYTDFTPQPEPERTGMTDLFGDALAAPTDDFKSLFENTGSLGDDTHDKGSSLLKRATSLFDEAPTPDRLTDLFGDTQASDDDFASLFENTGSLSGNSSSNHKPQGTTQFDADELPSTGNLTDLFGDVNNASDDDFASLFENTGSLGNGDERSDYDNPLAWMHDAGVEMSGDDQPSFGSLLADEDGPLPEFDASPLAWLEGSNSDMIVEDDATPASDDIFSWMQDEQQPASAAQYTPAAEAESESLDWLQDAHLLDDTLSYETKPVSDLNGTEQEDDFAFSTATIEGQSDMLDQKQSPTAETNEPAVPGGRRGLTAILQDGNFDWVNPAQTNEVGSDAEMDDWLNQFGTTPTRTAPTDTPDWLTDLSVPDVKKTEDDEWFDADESQRLAPLSQANAAQFAQMSNGDDEDEEADWLSALPADDEDAESDADNTSEDDFAWMSADDSPETTEDEETTDTGALPDWLTDFVPAAAGNDPAPSMAESVASINWGSDEDDEDSALTDWLADVPAEDDEAEEAAAASEFSWANTAVPDAVEVEDEAETDWLAELQPASERGAAAVGDVSWLAELENASTDNEPESEPELASVEDDMSWLSEIAPEGETLPEVAAMETPAASEEMAWLAELESEAEAEAVPAEAVASDDDGMDWLSELAPASEILAEADASAEAIASDDEGMDWLSELAPASEVLAEADAPAEASSSDDISWLTELETAVDAPEAEAEPVEAVAASADDMSWLSELEPAAETVAETPSVEVPAVSIDDFPWMSADAYAEEAPLEAAVASDDADWLNEFAPEAEQPPVTLTPAASSDLEWLAELDAATTPAVSTEDFPWMAEEEAADEEAIAEPVAADEADWLSELESATEPVAETPLAAAASTDEDMSWLTELEPTSEPEQEAAGELATEVMGEADSWLANDDNAHIVPPEVPDWLSELEPEADAEPDAESVAASSEEDDWLTDADEADDVEEEAVAADVPDWLTDLEPTPEPEQEAAAEMGEEVAAVAATLSPDEALEEDDAFAAALENEGELVPTPAQNAPDWLNAMVPGLDVDYEAPDEDFSGDDEPFDADEREYAWVEEMVEQEMTAVEGAGFTFSRPPSWFASLNSVQGGGTEDDFPDWVSGDADDDANSNLPEYLR